MKKEGIPIRLVPEGTSDASVVGVRRVNELDYYSLGHKELAAHVGLTPNRTTAVIWYLDLQADPDCFKEIAIGGSRFKRYSQKAIGAIREAVKGNGIDAIWQAYKAKTRPNHTLTRGLPSPRRPASEAEAH